MPILSIETQMKVAEWRQKAREGTLSIEESREALRMLREDRVSAGVGTAKAAKSRSVKAQAAAVDTSALLARFKAAPGTIKGLNNL